MISQEDYQDLFIHQRNEDENFNDLENHLKGQVKVDKLNDDFEILIYFKMLVKSLPPLSYPQHNEMEVLTKEMVAYEFASTSQWVKIVKFGKKLKIL